MFSQSSVLVKKGESPGKKCDVRTMMYSEADKDFIMNSHNVTTRQIVEEISLEKQ